MYTGKECASAGYIHGFKVKHSHHLFFGFHRDFRGELQTESLHFPSVFHRYLIPQEDGMVSEQGDINGFQTFCHFYTKKGDCAIGWGYVFFRIFFRCDYEIVTKKVLVAGGTVKGLCRRRRAFDER
jgi:hypothetical protein